MIMYYVGVKESKWRIFQKAHIFRNLYEHLTGIKLASKAEASKPIKSHNFILICVIH